MINVVKRKRKEKGVWAMVMDTFPFHLNESILSIAYLYDLSSIFLTVNTCADNE